MSWWDKIFLFLKRIFFLFRKWDPNYKFNYAVREISKIITQRNPKSLIEIDQTTGSLYLSGLSRSFKELSGFVEKLNKNKNDLKNSQERLKNLQTELSNQQTELQNLQQIQKNQNRLISWQQLIQDEIQYWQSRLNVKTERLAKLDSINSKYKGERKSNSLNVIEILGYIALVADIWLTVDAFENFFPFTIKIVNSTFINHISIFIVFFVLYYLLIEFFSTVFASWMWENSNGKGNFEEDLKYFNMQYRKLNWSLLILTILMGIFFLVGAKMRYLNKFGGKLEDANLIIISIIFFLILVFFFGIIFFKSIKNFIISRERELLEYIQRDDVASKVKVHLFFVKFIRKEHFHVFQTRIDNLKKQIQTIEERIGELKSNKERIENFLNKPNKIPDLQSNIQDLQGELSNLQSEIGNLSQVQVVLGNNLKNTLQNIINNIQNNVQGAQTTVNRLQNIINNIQQNNIQGIQTIIDDLEYVIRDEGLSHENITKIENVLSRVNYIFPVKK